MYKYVFGVVGFLERSQKSTNGERQRFVVYSLATRILRLRAQVPTHRNQKTITSWFYCRAGEGHCSNYIVSQQCKTGVPCRSVVTSAKIFAGVFLPRIQGLFDERCAAVKHLYSSQGKILCIR